MTDTSSTFSRLVAGVRVEGPLLPEPVEVIAAIPMGASVKLVARGLRTNQVHQPLLDAAQLATLTITSRDEPFDGDARWSWMQVAK
jgi:hypothetical protein